ncbi:MAG TPA: hypothetical protein VHF87_18360 [Methylomirabilota bacterium]|nr:hypothetical protein [Methylomirabilota bacterium]
MRGAALTAAAISLAAGLIVSRPLPAEITHGLPVGPRQLAELPVLTRVPADTLQLYYQLWLVRDGLLGPTPLFTDPYQFRVDGPRWNLPQTFLPLALPFTALSVLGGHAAYNLLVLLSFPLSGLAAYGLARHLSGDAASAAVVGIGFALLPARLDPLFGGHPAGFALALVPAMLWGLDLALTNGRLAGGLGGGAAFVALAMLEPQYTYLAAALAVAHAGVRLVLAPVRRLRVAPLAAFAALAIIAGAWVLMLRNAFVAGSIAEAGRRIEEVRLFSQGLPGLAEPARYGGIALAVLAALGLGARGRAGEWRLRLLYGTALVLGVLLSVGPTIPRVPLYQAVHRWVPFFAMIRNPEKLQLLTSVAALVLAALGARALLSRAGPDPGRGRLAAAGGLLALVLVATPPWHGIAFARFGDSPVYETLRREASRVLYLPVWPGDNASSGLYLYAVTRTRIPMVNGYSPLVPRRYVRDVFEPLEALNVGDLGSGEADALRRLAVSHVVVDRAGFPPQVSPYPSRFTIDGLRASPVLGLHQFADPLWLFRVTDAAPAPIRRTSPVGLFLEAERQNHETGAVAGLPDASGGQVVVGRPGTAPGFLTFGPYRPLPAGAYVARFRARGHGLRLDVATDRGQRILAQRAVDPGPAWVDEELPFVVEHARPLEFRVSWNGREEAAVDWVLVVATDRPELERVYEVEALPHRLGEREDPEASGGWAAHADPVESLRGELLSGPARLFPAGRYRLAVRLRAEAAGQGPLLRLSVTEPAGRTLAARVVDAAEAPPGAYREVTLDFALDRPTVLEAPVTYLGGVGILFDRVTITPR